MVFESKILDFFWNKVGQNRLYGLYVVMLTHYSYTDPHMILPLIYPGQGHKSWGSTVSDDSVGGDGGLESPTASTSEQELRFTWTFTRISHLYIRIIKNWNCFLSAETCLKIHSTYVWENLFKVRIIVGDISKIARTASTGTMSSNEDADEKDGNVASFESPSKISRISCIFWLCSLITWLWVFSGVCMMEGSFFLDINGMDPDVVVSTRPFRNIGLSKAALTHRLRKLRTPAKCRECDSYVYFQGAECEEVRSLSCRQLCPEKNFRIERRALEVSHWHFG